MQQVDIVFHIHFFPLDPQHFISISDSKVQEWNIDGYKIEPEYDASYIAFSLNGTKFALCNGAVVQV